MVSEASIRILMKPLTILLKFIRTQYILLSILLLPTVIFIFTLARYYGFYYDNHYFNLLALDLMEKFRPYLYLGSHYSIHSSLYSYLVLPLFHIFGPTDFSLELLSSLFHLCTIFVCFKLGRRFFDQSIGWVFAFLVAIAPIHLVNIYTWPEYSLITFLNTLSIYYFLAGFQDMSKWKLIISSLLYSLSCFQAIYSILLLPFFIIYALIQAILYSRNYEQTKLSQRNYRKYKFLSHIFKAPVLLAFLYLIILLQVMYADNYATLFYLSCILFLFLLYLGFRWLPETSKRILKFCFLFFVIFATIMLLLDLFIQLDVNFFGQKFGYYRDTTFAGGFGTTRQAFVFKGRPIRIFACKIYVSVLNSLFFFSSNYSKVSFSLLQLWKTMSSYYRKCFPLLINIFMIIGLIGFITKIFYRKYKKQTLDIKYIFPSIWIIGIVTSFINVQPHHILRIYILPMPYFFAAWGIYYLGFISKYIATNIFKVNLKDSKIVIRFTILILALALNLSQLRFLLKNVYQKYKYDKAHSNYYQLF